MTKPPASAAQPPGKAWHSQSIEEVLAQRGSDIMQAIALPSPGGMSVSVVTMFIVPCLFCAIEERKWQRKQRLGLAQSQLAPAS